MSRVLIHPAEYDSVQAAVDRVFELFPVDLEGKKVLLKPNVLRGAEANEGITTHPAVLKAVAEKVASFRPASLIVGDNPGAVSYGANEASFRQTGLMEAAGPWYQNIGNDSVPLPFDPEYMKSVSVSRAIMEADVYITLPKFKTHGLTVLTGAIKNSYGILPGAQKALLHKLSGGPEKFHEIVVKVFGLRPPDLCIMDAVVGMEGNGPASPDLRKIGCILASDNAVALDTVMAAMMGLDPEKLPFLCHARDAGYGSCRLSDHEVIGELTPIPDFKVPPLGGEANINNPAIREMLHSKTLVVPRADPETCIGCGICVEQCPVNALHMEDDLPVVNEDICITCFCCQEMCPEKAIALS